MQATMSTGCHRKPFPSCSPGAEKLPTSPSAAAREEIVLQSWIYRHPNPSPTWATTAALIPLCPCASRDPADPPFLYGYHMQWQGVLYFKYIKYILYNQYCTGSH